MDEFMKLMSELLSERFEPGETPEDFARRFGLFLAEEEVMNTIDLDEADRALSEEDIRRLQRTVRAKCDGAVAALELLAQSARVAKIDGDEFASRVGELRKQAHNARPRSPFEARDVTSN